MDKFSDKEIHDIKEMWKMEDCEGTNEIGEAIIINRLIQTIEQQQEKINYYEKHIKTAYKENAEHYLYKSGETNE